MSDQSRYEFVSVADAANRLGLSISTVKRRIREGLLEAEAISRPQGIEYRVQVPRLEPAPTTDDADSEDEPQISTDQWNVAAAITAATTPLSERIAALDERNERQAAIVVEQAQRIGRLEAERNAAEARAAQLAADLILARQSWWRRLLG
jgi:hypothetical protein